jgi:hypothetical protein
MENNIYITQPSGQRVVHGKLIGSVFYRSVKEKDKMRIFDAWSINPNVLDQIKDSVKLLEYYNIDNNQTYKISMEDALKNGFEREFSGGKTFYIPLKFWKTKTKEEELEEFSRQCL